MNTSGIIYSHDWVSPASDPIHTATSPVTSVTPPSNYTRHDAAHRSSWTTLLGLGLIALALGGITGPLTPRIRMESKYYFIQARTTIVKILASKGDALRSYFSIPFDGIAMQSSAPIAPAFFDPLKTADGTLIEPVNKDFSLVIPKIGINASVIPAVNPTKPGEYLPALEQGIAHSSLSYFPDEDGTVYLFSHSTNYEWFVNDLNAVFYLLKNLEEDDLVVLFYKGNSYTYKITGKQVVKPTAVSFLVPQAGARRLILQTCWPPGSTSERLLIFADLVESSNGAI